jgi:thioester reductase-like protein
MNIAENITIKTLKVWCDVAYSDEQTFLERFAPFCTDIANISWSVDEMRVSALTEDGDTVVHSVKMNEWLDYLNN